MQTTLFTCELDVVDEIHGQCRPDEFDCALRNAGVSRFLGVDEAGRGPLAGPVVAAAVALPPEHAISGLRDSKQVPEAEREELYALIVARAEAWGAAIVDVETIDRINILNAALQAMAQAVRLSRCNYPVLVDGNRRIPALRNPQRALVKGDARSATVAAASIVAKVSRDRIMEMYHRQFPQYNFLRNKGYGTREHREAILKYGRSKIHRRSFRVSGFDDLPVNEKLLL